MNIECRTSIERYAQTVMKLIDRFCIKKEICGKQNTGKKFEIPGFLKKHILELSPRLSPTAFWAAPFFRQKVRKTPDFLTKSGVFMVAEAGLEPTTSGL